MNVLNKANLLIFIIWLLIVPPGILHIFLNYAPQEINWVHLILFTAFGILTIYFPAIRNGRPVFLVMWVTLPAFLICGIFIEILVMQISSIAMLFAYKGPVSIVKRYFLNSTLYFILSIAAAGVFHLVGGVVGALEFWPVLIAALCYQLTHTVLHDLTSRICAAYSEYQSPYFSKDFLWCYGTAFLVLPFALVLYYLIHFVGNGAFLLLGIPYFLVIFIARLYNNSEKINDNLRQVGEIGHRLSDNLTEDKVLNQFVKKSSELFNAEFSYLFDHKDGWLELIRSYEKGSFIETPLINFSSGEGITESVLQKNKPVIYAKKEEWANKFKSHMYQSHAEFQSVLCVPISRNQKIEGVLFLSTERKNAFEEFQLKTLDILCSYFTVSVERARYVEETVRKSERCALTKLYNYIYLEERLEIEMVRIKQGTLEELSVLMLDIDHFKSVNDTYGHQSGNDILAELAGVLKSMVPQDGLVARYGGEEFVFLLPGKSKKEAMFFAEKIREKIEHYRFQIYPDFGEDGFPIDVKVTASIGVSTSPEDTKEAKALLRNADRSLYLGAKQAGRNRVASYVK